MNEYTHSLKESLNPPSKRDLEGILDAIACGDWLSVKFEIFEYPEKVQTAIKDLYGEYVKYFTEKDDGIAFDMEEALEKKRAAILASVKSENGEEPKEEQPTETESQL
jgi:hypothetical protein